MRYPKWLWFIFAIAIVALPIFGCLDLLPVQLWDESRVAINAYELYRSKQWLVTTYNGLPDTWNTKPPLLVWMQVLSFKLFGVNELALRLPSALAGAFTCLLLLWFFIKSTGKPAMGLIAVIVLVSSQGYIKYHHSPRTGDYDAMLALFTFSYCALYYLFIQTGRRGYLLLTLLVMTLAVMTKSIAGLLFIPGLFLFTIYKRKLLAVLKAPQLYIGSAIFFVIVFGYYYLRAQQTPGYIDIIMGNDITGRFGKSNATDRYISNNFWHYFELLSDSHFNYWYLLALAGLVLGVCTKDSQIRDLTVFASLAGLSHLLIISKGVNKTDWYDLPAYPFLSMIAAIGIWNIYWIILSIDTSSLFTKRTALGIAFLIIVTIRPYFSMVHTSLNPDPGGWIEGNTHMCSYLKDMYHGQPQAMPDSVILLKDSDYQANIEWYLKVFRDKNVYTQIIDTTQLDRFRTVVAFQPRIKKYINNNFNLDSVKTPYKNVIEYTLNGRKG